MAEEWVNKARNDAKTKVHFHLKMEKALGAIKEENKDLLSKLVAEERERKFAQAGLKNAEAQAEDQHKLLYQIEIELAILRQLVLDLSAELQQAKEATQLAREAAETEKQAFYTLGVEETQARLIEESVEVCRDYCYATWDEALNVAGVLADSAWRQPGSIYYHPHIHEVPGAIPSPRAILSPSALVLEASKQPLVVQTTILLLEASKGSNEIGDQCQRAEGAKDKGKGKGTKPPLEAKDAVKAKNK